jgi:hypothetical protein
MTAPLAYNQWLGNQFLIPELPPVTPYTVTPPTVNPAQQQAPVYWPQQPNQYQMQGDSEGGSPPGISAPYSGGDLGSPFGPMNNATMMGRVGMGASLLGAPMGLGLLGTGIGAAVDASNAEQQAGASYGTRGNEISGLSAFGAALTGGLLGSSAADQLSDLGFEASSTPGGTFGTFGYEPETSFALTMEDLQAMQDAAGGEAPGGYDAGSDFGASTTAAEQEAAMAEGSAPDGGGADGGDDKIICTELYRQGKLPRHIYENDAQVGREFAQNDPLVMKGYHLWGRPVARLMGRSRAVTAIVEPFAKAWAFHIAGQKSLLGAVLFNVGVPICRMIGYVAKGNARGTGRNLAPSG